jgi:peptide/nickel transport system ATP-binding protein
MPDPQSHPQLTKPLLEVNGLSIHFGQHCAVNNISFQIYPGQTLGLVGESGSGKSATSLAILRLLPPSARVTGSIRFSGRELLTLPEAEMRHHRGRDISMIFQEPMTALNPVMTIGTQIAEGVQAHHPELSRTAIRTRVLEAMHQVALPDPERRYRDYPYQFSGGQRQRILIAMALVNKPADKSDAQPRLLIADEPTTALDVTVQAQILILLRELRTTHNLAMLFISHDLAVVAQACDQPGGQADSRPGGHADSRPGGHADSRPGDHADSRPGDQANSRPGGQADPRPGGQADPRPGDSVAVMQHGQIVEYAPTQDLFLHPTHPYTRQLLASAPTMHTDRSQPLAAIR